MKLKRPSGVRRVYHKCCANCQYKTAKPDVIGILTVCKRDINEEMVILEGELIYITVCDRFKRI